MKTHDTQLKCTWTNGIIWAVITAIAGGLFRNLIVYFCIVDQLTLEIGGQAVTVFFTSEFYSGCWTLIMGCIFIPLVAYLFMYWRYMKIAGTHPTDLHAVAKGDHGRPWIAALLIQIVLTIVWAVIGAIFIKTAYTTGAMTVNDRVDIEAFLVLMGFVLVFDLLLFFIGKLLFKPDLVQKNA